jgi:hypothetical protein
MYSGTLELIDDKVCFRVDGSVNWELPISAVRIIGEATNGNGPYLDDYFFCFATDASSWHQASFYAEGRDEFLKQLSKALGYELVPKLVGSTDFDSNVMWPPLLAGIKMFSYKPVQPRTWIGRLFGTWSTSQWFSVEVLAELQRPGQSQ